MSDTNTIETIMTELKQRRDWNNPEEVEIWFERKLREVKAEAEKKLLRTLLIECDRTENEGGRLLVTTYILKVKKNL